MNKNILLDKYERYILRNLGLAWKTMLGYKYKLEFYIDWLIDNNLNAKSITLDETYDFIAHRRSLGDSDRNIAGYKTAIQHFNQCIKMKSNPMLFVKLSKTHKTTPTNLLDEEFLETIYRDAVANTLVQKRDRCMLGLIVFLGLQRNELEALELDDIDISEMKITISATPNSNGRTLKLHGKQIAHLMDYYYTLRAKLLIESRKNTTKLFFSNGTGTGMNGAINRMLPRLKKEFNYIKDFQHLKQSRVAIWVKEHGLRDAQYLGGYKYVTSVQRYDFKSIDDLKTELEQLHPMNFF